MSIPYLHRPRAWLYGFLTALLFILIVVQVAFGYSVVDRFFALVFPLPAEQSFEASATNEPSSDNPPTLTSSAPVADSDLFPNVLPMAIAGVAVKASVASTFRERLQGLSGTPYLPLDTVKLFVFEEPGAHGIWMKDMRYPIDIAWVDREGTIVHLEPSVDPSTYPTSFSSPVPALYVIEANAGFFSRHAITVGETVVLPELK